MHRLPALERLAHLLAAERRRQASLLKLQPVQLEIVDYLARCNRYSDSPAAVAEYFGLTKGTVSQSLTRLEEKGLVEKRADPADGRRLHLGLTESGREVALESTESLLGRAASGLDPREVAAFDRVAVALLREVQKSHGRKPFGVCRGCRMFEILGEEEGLFRCGLTGEALSETDSVKLCREFEAVG